MMRNLVCLVLFASLAMLAGAWSAASVEKAKPAGPRPTAKPVAPARKLSLAEKLQQSVDFPGIDDPKTTFLEELKKLEKDHGLAFDVNEKAFKYENLNDVLRQEVANPTAIPPMKRRLKVVLRKILERIPIPSGATYLIRDDVIEVTTHHLANAEIYHPHREPVNPNEDEKTDGTFIDVNPFPLVVADFRQKPLADALDDLAEENDVNIVLDSSVGEKKAKTPVTMKVRNVPIDTAVLMLARMADLHCVQLDNALFVTTPEKGVALRNSHLLRRTHRKDAETEDSVLKKEEELTDRIGKKALEDRRGGPKGP